MIIPEKPGNTMGSWFRPGNKTLWVKWSEVLWALKRTEISEPAQKKIIEQCFSRLERAKHILESPIISKNYYLFWSLLHSVDEDLLLLIPWEELKAKALNIKCLFELNIKHKTLRREWLGDEGGKKGKLIIAIEKLWDGSVREIEEARYILKEVLHIINNRTDELYMELAFAKLIVVLSTFSIMVIATLFWFWYGKDFCWSNWHETFVTGIRTCTFLGIMGALLSNVITGARFLFIKGLFWRLIFYHIFSRSVVGILSASFVYLIVKSQFILTLTAPSEGNDVLGIILKAPSEYVSYVYALLAITAGFAGDKFLRGMIDKVAGKLEQEANKNKESQEES